MSAPPLPRRAPWSAYLGAHPRGQAGIPFQPLARIQRAQARRVRAMVAHTYRTVPYHRDTMRRLGPRPDDFPSADDLARLPLLERDQIQRDPDYFLSTAWSVDRHPRPHGGGSGTPRAVYHDAAALFQNAAHGERERLILIGRLGRRLGYRERVIASGFNTAATVQTFWQVQRAVSRFRSTAPGERQRDRRYSSGSLSGVQKLLYWEKSLMRSADEA